MINRGMAASFSMLVLQIFRKWAEAWVAASWVKATASAVTTLLATTASPFWSLLFIINAFIVIWNRLWCLVVRVFSLAAIIFKLAFVIISFLFLCLTKVPIKPRSVISTTIQIWFLVWILFTWAATIWLLLFGTSYFCICLLTSTAVSCRLLASTATTTWFLSLPVW